LSTELLAIPNVAFAFNPPAAKFSTPRITESMPEPALFIVKQSLIQLLQKSPEIGVAYFFYSSSSTAPESAGILPKYNYFETLSRLL
jgi:hypothetical protein